MSGAHRGALLDWLACAAGGSGEPAARAARRAGSGEGVAAAAASLGAAGHVLDFDDTYLPGVAHLSAAAAPAALAVGVARAATVGEVLAAYAAGFEWTGALARASHPALYERGWHPTAVCGTVGAAAAAAALLGLEGEELDAALGLAGLRAAGARGGFGSDGKALGVGLAAAEGVACARLAAAGAHVPAGALEGPHGFGAVTGGTWAVPDPAAPAIAENWIKLWPCCLMAHAPIAAALTLGGPGALPAGALVVRVHPRARQAAAYDDVHTGLEAKFSIAYLVAFTLLHGGPGVSDFEAVRADARALAAERLRVVTDPTLAESEARLEDEHGTVLARVLAAPGSPRRPLDPAQLAGKIANLAGDRLDGALDDPSVPATSLVAAITGA